MRIRAIRDSLSFCPFEHSGFDIVWDFVLRISNFFLSMSSASPRGRSTVVATPLQIALFFAKQSQCQNRQNEHKYSKNKGLCQRTTDNEQRTLLKTKPIQTQRPKGVLSTVEGFKPETRALLDPERPVVSKVEPSRRANQTQFQTRKHFTQLAGRESAAAVRPKCIIPIHTFFPEKYFELLGSNVKLIKDRETVEI